MKNDFEGDETTEPVGELALPVEAEQRPDLVEQVDEYEAGDDDDSGTPTEIQERQAIRREKLITALARGYSDAEAARYAGCSTRTLRRLRKDRDFRHEVSARRSEFLGRQAGLLIGSADLARAAIIDCLDSEVEGVRLRAAELLLRVAERLHLADTEADADFLELQAKYEAMAKETDELRGLLGLEDEQ